MASIKVDLEVGNDGVVVITMCNPPVNALAIPIIMGLKDKFDEAGRRNDVKAIVLTGRGGRFSGGFDISVMQKVHQTGDITLVPNVSVEPVVNSIEGCNYSLSLPKRRTCLDVSLRRKVREPKEENVTLGPVVRDGEHVFGVAHIFASFNDTFIHVTDLSGKETLVRITGGIKVKADRDESSPYAAMLAAQDVAARCKELGITALHIKLRTTSGNKTKHLVLVLSLLTVPWLGQE